MNENEEEHTKALHCIALHCTASWGAFGVRVLDGERKESLFSL